MNCPYCKSTPCLFQETYLGRKEKRGHAQPPKPMIIIPPFFGRKVNLQPGEKIFVDVILLGKYIESFLQLVLAMISFGQAGIGADRHYGANRFEVKSVKCLESGGYVLENNNIKSGSFASNDLKNLKPIEYDEIVLSFRTPFTGPFFPSRTKDVIRLIRNRLILFVNEYGTGEQIPEVNVDGECFLREVRRHTLRRRSMRSEKDFFRGWTGSLQINLSNLPSEARWLLAVSSILGMGPDSAFGAGFVDIFNQLS